MSQIKTSDVSNFIRDMVDLTMVFETDEEGYVVKKQSGERLTISDGGVQCPLIIYQEVVKDQTALTINPLAEGLGSTPSSLWFFNTQKTALLGRIFTLFIKIVQVALDEKKSKKDSQIPMELLNIAAKIIDSVDERLLQEIIPLTEDKETNEVITIYYQRKQLRSVLRCALFDEEEKDAVIGIPPWKSKFPKIRNKTWPVLETIMLSILNIKEKDDIAKFTKKADVISCARLSSFLNVLLAVYQEINPLLEAINPDIAIDLSKMVFHLNNLSAYAENAKFMVQPSRSSQPQQPQNTIPGTVPTIPMAIPGYPQISAPVPQPAVSLVPGPMYADGRVSAPTPIIPAGGYPPAYMQGQGGYPPAMPPGHGGIYMPPQQQPQYYGQPQQQPFGGIPQSIPFDGPYLTGNYPPGNMGNINLLPPGVPPGFNPNYR